MADINKIKKINGKEIVADWSNIENKPDDLAKTSDIEEQIKQIRTEIPSIEGLASEEYVDDRFEELTGAAPEALDTLEELAKALGEDANYSATIIEELAKKQDRLTFDDKPIKDSINPVTSGGLFTSLLSKMDVIEGVESNINDYFNKTPKIYRIYSTNNEVVTKQYFLICTFSTSKESDSDTNYVDTYYQIKIEDSKILVRSRRSVWENSWGWDEPWTLWTSFLNSSDIVNSLTDTSTTKTLSANQGRILNELKVDKVEGKGLSTNDFTDEEKSKIENISGIYIQAEEPTDAKDGSIWIDTNEELGTLPIAEEASF